MLRKRTLSQKTKNTSWLVHFGFIVFHVTYFILPISIAIFLTIKPCTPPLLGSVLIPAGYCSVPLSSSFFSIIIRVPIILLEMFILVFSAVNGSFYMVYVLMAGLIYVLQETDKVSTIHNQGGFFEYRKLQVLEQHLNSCIRSFIFPSIAFVVPCTQIVAAFAICRLHNSMETSMLIFLMVVFSETFCINILLFSGAKKAHIQSEKWLLKMWELNRKDKIQRRVVKSMLPLRMWFGSNWVDRMTPMVIQQFCSIQTSNLLLVL